MKEFTYEHCSYRRTKVGTYSRNDCCTMVSCRPPSWCFRFSWSPGSLLSSCFVCGVAPNPRILRLICEFSTATASCKARPSFDGCGTSLSVSLSLSLPCVLEPGCVLAVGFLIIIIFEGFASALPSCRGVVVLQEGTLGQCCCGFRRRQHALKMVGKLESTIAGECLMFFESCAEHVRL